MSAAMEPPPPTPEQLAAWAQAQEEAEREMAAADAAAEKAAKLAASAPAPTSSRRLPQSLLFALPILLGAGGAVASTLLFPHPPQPTHAEEAHATEPAATEDPVALDTLIRAGAFADGLAMCQRQQPAKPEGQRSLAYREAICLEALGRLKEAGEAYKRAEPGEKDHAAWARAALGQARCAAAAGDLAAAQQLLDRVFLRSGHPECSGTHILEECLFLRARLSALQLGPVRAIDPFEPEAVAWPTLSGALDKYYEWLPPDTTPAGSVGPASPNALTAQRNAKVAGGFEITAHLAERPLPEIIKAVAAAAGLKLQLDAAPLAALGKEVTAVDVEAVPLDELLVALTGRFGVKWKGDAAGLTASLAPKAGPGDRAAVARAFQRAIAAAPEHPFHLSAHVYLGNYESLAGNLREAAKEYQFVLEADPEAPQVPHAMYNLGLVELRRGELPAARSRFVSLGDRAPGSRWADYGWWWAGRTHLDVGDEAAAKKAFRTALGGRTRAVTSAAAIGLCACELTEGSNEAARNLLADHRIDSRDTHAALATLFESLVLYRTTPTENRRKVLLDAFGDASNAGKLGPYGAFLTGRVYRDLGMPERTAAVYDKASESIRGPLAVRMTFEAAQWYDLIDRFQPARQRYLAVAAADPKGYGSKAELHLAGMALRERRAEECIRRCRGLVDRPGIERTEVLELMGRGYELQRNYRLAAECFAGRVPEE